MTEGAVLAKKTDAVTRWWRGTSLRAKVTGVTVAVLAGGLLAAGIGTVPFLRGSLIASLDESLVSLAPSDVGENLFDVSIDEAGVVDFNVKDNAPDTQYYVALYGPDGDFVISGGGSGGPAPVYPATQKLEQTQIQGQTPFPLESTGKGAGFHASVAIIPVTGTGNVYTQLVALPLTSIDQSIATYLGIFSILALFTVIAGALLTRWLVTLTFRGLGQVESTAMSISAGDFSQRMTDIEPGTEVGRLKLAINTMLGRVDASISERDATVRQMRRFIGDASHELRTPLVTVRGYAELYRMGAIEGDDDTAQAMDRIEKEAIRMGVLVEDLLNLARLDEHQEVALAPVDLRPIARDAALDVRAASPLRTVTVLDKTAPIAPAPVVAVTGEQEALGEPAPRRRGAPSTSGITLAGRTVGLLRRKPRPVPASGATTAKDAGATQPPLVPVADARKPGRPVVEGPLATAPIVLGDENRIRQVVANLLGNARRFTADDSPIELEVGVDPRGGTASIAVIDHGEGIPAQIREQIFQRFWRADTSRARETGGSGLGLAIVASIVDALHGTVVVEDTPGGGATFRVHLPLANGREGQEHLLIPTQPMPRIDVGDTDL
ncbi:MAG TPA: HAMP domain-containing sensor histidine kinase [Microbacterium sp.]|uniref:sensor histidine kinase n=1 Tax=Microbacterium sp. TaxID=51671 RepID=UPI002CB6F09D|nr:HAMP domain-containing sensor histidine kinase [Microbacterium sp.]HWI30276.1 HAMP domain-containing sensor histidine kinase [Microbacterium sp.]